MALLLRRPGQARRVRAYLVDVAALLVDAVLARSAGVRGCRHAVVAQSLAAAEATALTTGTTPLIRERVAPETQPCFELLTSKRQS